MINNIQRVKKKGEIKPKLLKIVRCGAFLLCFQVPKPGEGHNTHAETPQELLGTVKQVSYKTEIIGGVPIITATQVTLTAASGRSSSAGPVLPVLVCSCKYESACRNTGELRLV